MFKLTNNLCLEKSFEKWHAIRASVRGVLPCVVCVACVRVIRASACGMGGVLALVVWMMC